MRVFAVPQRPAQGKAELELLGKRDVLPAVRPPRPASCKRQWHCRIRSIARTRRRPAGGGVQSVVPPCCSIEAIKALILVGAREHGDVLVVLGGRTQQRGPADVDVLDGFGESRTGSGDRGLEGIEVHDHQIDGWEALLTRAAARSAGNVAASQDAGVDLGMEGLDPAAQDLGLAGEVGHFRDLDAGVQQGSPRAAAGQQLGPGREPEPGPGRSIPSCHTHSEGRGESGRSRSFRLVLVGLRFLLLLLISLGGLVFFGVGGVLLLGVGILLFGVAMRLLASAPGSAPASGLASSVEAGGAGGLIPSGGT